MFVSWQSDVLLAVLFVAFTLLVGYIYERTSAWRDRRLHPPPGRLVNVNGQAIHLLCKGTTGPTIVIEQGAGELSRFWWPLQEEAAKFAKVCTYDRPGFAWSDPAKTGRTIADRADELRAMLSTAGIQGPVIFVAHSYGGLIVRSFTERYPGEVAGLVFVDTAEEFSIFQRDVLDFYAKTRKFNQVVAFSARFGILRLLRHFVALDRFGFWLNSPAEYAALCDDLASLERVPELERRSKQAGSFGALPMIVITHGRPFPGPFAILESHWSESQKRLAALSTDSVLIVAGNSNHMIQQDEPELVLEAIRRVHESVTSSRRLN